MCHNANPNLKNAQIHSKPIHSFYYTIRVYFTPMPGGPCWADCSKFLHVGWHPRRNHEWQILSRSRRGLRTHGGPKSGFSYSFSNRSYNSVLHYRATLWFCQVTLHHKNWQNTIQFNDAACKYALSKNHADKVLDVTLPHQRWGLNLGPMHNPDRPLNV